MTVPGKGGRPRKPGPLRAVDGDKADRFNGGEPVPAAQDVHPPAWLVALDHDAEVGTETALDVWNRLAPDLIDKRVLTTWDADTFAVYCDAVIRHRAAAEQVERHGLLVFGAKDNLVKNPACQLTRDYAAIMVSIGARFGLSASDRAGLKIERTADRGGAERLLS